MANNVPVTAGAGTTVATDQLGTGEHVQLMKLMDGTEDSTGRIGGDATNGLDVDVTRVQGTVTIAALARTTSSIATTLAVDKLMNNLTAVTPIMAAISASTSGNNTLLAAQGAGNIILVHQLILVALTAVTVQFQSGAAGTNLTGAMPLAANSGFVLPFSPMGWFKTAANTLLNLSLGGAISVTGNFGYTVIT